MSTNIKVQRICQRCGKEFTARTTTTKYCSHKCNSAAYKANVRSLRVEISNIETHKIKTKPLEELNAKEFLTVRDAAVLLSSSVRTVYRLIDQGKINAVNLSQRKTLIIRSEIDKLFRYTGPDQSGSITKMQKNDETDPALLIDENDCYTLIEVQEKYHISSGALYQLIKRNRIPKINKNSSVYVSKSMIDKLLR